MIPPELLQRLTASPSPAAPVITVYAGETGPRMRFTCDFIFHAVLRVNYTLSSNPAMLASAHVYYSGETEGNGIRVIPCGILGETGLRSEKPHPVQAGGWCLFPDRSAGGFGFDLFGAVFYMISRYEEWQPFVGDSHRRFEARASVFYGAGGVEIPWVDRWIAAFRNSIRERFPEIGFPPAWKLPLSTIDVDNLYAFRSKGLVRTAGGMAKDILSLKLANLWDRMSAVLRLKRDPFDVYADVVSWCRQRDLPVVFFFLYGGRTEHDRGIAPSAEVFAPVFRTIGSGGGMLGIHPSYATREKPEEFRHELRLLRTHSDKEVIFSRQHYLRMDTRHTPKELIAAGIKADFTMGFASAPGFRAGTAHPFRYFDLALNEEKDLVMVPFCAMDGAYTVYSKTSCQQALDSIKALSAEVANTGGCFVTVFHERTFYDRLYPGFSHLYKKSQEEALRLITAHAG